MKLSRIDLIAQNGGDGVHYKYTEAADKLWAIAHPVYNPASDYDIFIREAVKLLMEAFPNDET